MGQLLADPAQTPKRGAWVCPCNGCTLSRKLAFEQILEMLYETNDLSYNAWRVKERYLNEFPTKPKRKQ